MWCLGFDYPDEAVFEEMQLLALNQRPKLCELNEIVLCNSNHCKTSFPQISLATIDAIRNLGSLYAGGLGPGTLVGSAAFDLFSIHAVCVVVPKAGELKKISDIGVWLVELVWSFWAYIWLYIILKVWTPNVITVWEASLTVLQYGLLLIHAYAQDKHWPYVSLPMTRDERPEDWVPAESHPCRNGKMTLDKYSESEMHEVGNRNIAVLYTFW